MILEHRLHDLKCQHYNTTNQSPDFQAKYIVFHYTVVLGFRQCVEWFNDPDKQVSAHFVIGRNGEIAQMLPLNAKAWHCGQSSWQGEEGLNSSAIGIELENAGKLELKNGVLESWFGEKIDPHDVIWARHLNEESVVPWQKFTEIQLQKAKELAQILQAHYPIQAILGHDQIAPGRKIDPGPAFDRSLLTEITQNT